MEGYRLRVTRARATRSVLICSEQRCYTRSAYSGYPLVDSPSHG